MRLITRQIHLAFPELDRYSEEQCARFLRAARGSWLRRLFTIVAIWVVGACVSIGGVLLVSVITSSVLPEFDLTTASGLRFYAVIAAIILALALGPMSAIFLRDRLLGRRVRLILRIRGVCPSCWYSLVGLAVSPASTVSCPECGAVNTVDPSLGELTTDESGRLRFQPEGGHVDLGRPFWTPRRKRTAKRLALWGTVGVVLLVIIGLGGNELRVRAEVRAAKAARIGVEGLRRYVLDHQPPGADAPGAINAFDLIARAETIRDDADAAVWSSNQVSSERGRPISPDFGLLAARSRLSRPQRPLFESELDAASGALARRMVDEYKAAGLYDVMAGIPACRLAVAPIDLAPDAPPIGLDLPYLGTMRSLTRICAARMAVARERGDRESYLAAFEQGLALGRVASQQPFLIDGLVANAVDALMLDQVEDALRRPPPADWLDGLAAAMLRQRWSVNAAFHFEGERLMGVETIAWTFSDSSRFRFGRFSPGLSLAIDTSSPGVGYRLGSFSENITAYNQAFETAKKRVASDPVNRLPSSTPTTGSLALVDLLVPALDRAVASCDQIEFQRRAVSLHLAIERYRAAHSRPPGALSALVPEYLDLLLLDPYSGRPFIYKVLPEPDANGRAYLLYSVGTDGEDDGGVSGEESRKKSKDLTIGPSDIVINEPPVP